MTIPYHSHNFEIPAASKQDILDGVAADKVAVPACLGSAAAADSQDFATAAQGVKADNAVPAARFIRAGAGLAGGGALTQDITLALGQEQLQSIAAARQKAEEALQKAGEASNIRKNDLGELAFKNKLAVEDIAAAGILNSGTVLYGDGSWRVLPAGGTAGGDMYQALYDPRKKQADSFDMDNMTEGRVHKILSAAEKAKLAALPASAVSAKLEVQAGQGLAGGGALTSNVSIKLSDAVMAALEKGKTALQKSDCALLAFKNKAAVTDIEAGGLRSGKSFLRGDGVWAEPASAVPEQKSVLPAGMIAPFACLRPPEGWLICNGQAVSRRDYAALFAAIGILYGAGDGDSSFTLPDLRGEFIRGSDEGRGIDKERAFGSAQRDAMQNVRGGFSTVGAVFNADYFTFADGPFALSGRSTMRRTASTIANNKDPGAGPDMSFDMSRVARTAEETRPRNIAMLYCIKF